MEKERLQNPNSSNRTIAMPADETNTKTGYNPHEAEKKWQQFWEEEEIYAFDPSSSKPKYTIDTPPPTVSGKMHIGHAFSYAQGDFIARFQRMIGKAVFYPFGTDDNGLPTERLVEKEKKVQGHQMPKKAFRELCLETVNALKPEFIRPWKELGISANFKESYSTIDAHCQATSQRSFLELYEAGFIKKKQIPTAWCTTCRTAIAQAEFENKELESTFNDIIFIVEGKPVIISTTRPELLPACVAVFVNPNDKRYTHLHGKTIQVPLFGHQVPILTDNAVSMDKGSGVVMCCTFGDKTDIEWWQRFSLPLRVVITPDGKMNHHAKQFEGLSIKEARAAMLAALEQEGALVHQQQIVHAVNVHERCQTEIELLNTPQWFIELLEHKEILLSLADKINWYPEHMKVRYEHWVKNLSWDWCISRQRYYGVPIPVWYCKSCNTIIPAQKSQLPVDPLVDQPPVSQCPECGDSALIPEEDVLDTWATSSLTPQIATNWIQDPTRKETFSSMFPMSLRMQAHDIIRTWAFYTIVKAYYHHKDIPWKNIMISGHALDPKGQKMSKSKGNTVDPIAMMKKYNADALRYWAAGSKLGDDLPFLEKELVTGNKTITKLYNAAKFSFLHLQDYTPTTLSTKELEPIDQWLFVHCSDLIKQATFSFKQYEYSKAKQETDYFFWHLFCDQYLEISKGRLYNPDIFGIEKRRSAQYTLYHVLLSVIKLFAPIMPHITEEIYQMYYRQHEKEKSIHSTLWPTLHVKDQQVKDAGDLFVEILTLIRRYKSAKKLSQAAAIGNTSIILKKEQDAALLPLLRKMQPDLEYVTKCKAITVVVETKPPQHDQGILENERVWVQIEE
ncbi:MAG: valine--tRNA ligase [Candidatus Woesearchaeota archaeon]